MMVSLHVTLVVLAAALTYSPLTSAELELCGNKYCGIEAVCSKASRKCECPLSRPLGDPAFRCHSDDTVSCVLIGDPSLLGFTGDLTFLDFPCKYTFAKFDVPLLSRRTNSDPANAWTVADPGRDRCRIIAHGTNTVSPKGTYYLKSVNIVVSINVGGSKKLETLLVNLAADSATYSYAPYPEETVSKTDSDGCTPRVMDTANSIGLTLCYTEETKIWTLGIPICGGTSINFRAWEGVSENQPLRPGVSILTNGDNALFDKSNGYPNTMCDSPFNDAEDVYHETCKQVGIKGKRNCAFHAFLSNNPPEQPHYCMPSIELYNLCPPTKRVAAINGCGSIVTQLAKCVLKNDKDVMNTFETCIYSVCFNPSTCSAVVDNVHHGDEDDCNSFPAPC